MRGREPPLLRVRPAPADPQDFRVVGAAAARDDAGDVAERARFEFGLELRGALIVIDCAFDAAQLEQGRGQIVVRGARSRPQAASTGEGRGRRCVGAEREMGAAGAVPGVGRGRIALQRSRVGRDRLGQSTGELQPIGEARRDQGVLRMARVRFLQ